MTKEKNIPKKSKNIYIIGEITHDVTETVLIELLEDENINDLTELNMYISSPGGDLHTCLGIIDIINQQRKKIGYTVNTYGIGEISSGGFYLFTLGDNRKIYPSCRMYVHEHIVNNPDIETYSKKMESFKSEKLLNDIYVTLIAKQLSLSFKKAKSLLQKDKWLTDTEIKQYNILTGDIDE